MPEYDDNEFLDYEPVESEKETIDLSIEEYYCSKYAKESNDILAIRLKEVDLTIETINQDIQNVKNRINNIDNVVMDNIHYKEEIERIRLLVEEANQPVDQIDNVISPLKTDLFNKQTILFNALSGYYNSIVEELKVIEDPDSIIEKAYSVVNNIKDQSYFLASECTTIRFEIFREEKKRERKVEEATEKKEIYTKEIKDLVARVEETSKDELSNKLSSLEKLKKQNKELKKELEETFNAFFQKNIEKIKDSLRYLTLRQKTREEIMDSLDSLVQEALNNLRSQETLQSLKKTREIKIHELTDKINNFSGIEEEHKLRKALLAEYTKYAEEAKTLIDKLIDFDEKATLIINENDAFNESYQLYLKYKQEINQCNAQIKLIDSQLSQLLKERDEKALYAVDNEEIKIIVDKIANLRTLKEELQNKIVSATNEIHVMETDSNNIKLFLVASERIDIENKLPSLIENLHLLEDKKEEAAASLAEIENDIKEINKMKAEIASLSYELNN